MAARHRPALVAIPRSDLRPVTQGHTRSSPVTCGPLVASRQKALGVCQAQRQAHDAGVHLGSNVAHSGSRRATAGSRTGGGTTAPLLAVVEALCGQFHHAHDGHGPAPAAGQPPDFAVVEALTATPPGANGARAARQSVGTTTAQAARRAQRCSRPTSTRSRAPLAAPSPRRGQSRTGGGRAQRPGRMGFRPGAAHVPTSRPPSRPPLLAGGPSPPAPRRPCSSGSTGLSTVTTIQPLFAVVVAE